MSLVCPNAVRKSVEFFCWATISDGSGIQTLDWLLDNSQNGAQITSVAGMLRFICCLLLCNVILRIMDTAAC